MDIVITRAPPLRDLISKGTLNSNFLYFAVLLSSPILPLPQHTHTHIHIHSQQWAAQSGGAGATAGFMGSTPPSEYQNTYAVGFVHG